MGQGGAVRLHGAIAATVSSLLAFVAPACSFEGTDDFGPTEPPIPHGVPACGTPCENPAGCGICVDPGFDECVNGTVTRCTEGGTCRELIDTCPDPDACAGSICARSVDDCDAIASAYESAIAPSQGGTIVAQVRPGEEGLAPGEYGPGCPRDCEIVPGDCESGFNTCWLVGYRTDDMDRLAALYQRMGCAPLAECNCPPPPSNVACEGVQSSDPNQPFIGCVAR